MQVLLLVLLVAAFCVSTTLGYNVLCVMPIPSKSHAIVTQSICTELAARGQQVTAITAYPIKNPGTNYKQISVASLTEKAEEESRDIFNLRSIPMSLIMLYFMSHGVEISEAVLNHPEVKKFLETDQIFDVILMEIFLDESLMAGLSMKFKAPVVAVQLFLPSLWSNNLVGNPAPYSYIPDPFLAMDTKMTLFERVLNVLYGVVSELNYKLYYLPQQDSVMRRHFGHDLPYIHDILRNTSLVLVNHHFSLAYPRPYVPNMIEVSGMHVPTFKTLPKDLQDFLDKAENGAVYFSFGSNVQTNTLPKDKLEVILKVLGKLEMKILFKWEEDELPNKPDNVKFSKWFPQSDILAHPNTKLFVTHGGLGSLTESIYMGVPVVGIPIFAEQPLNMRHAELTGIGVMVPFDTMTVDSLSSAIQEVFENPKYYETVKKRSALLKDVPEPAMDKAVHWINYIVRHKGAPHMRSAVQDLYWYELYLLDVSAVLLAVVLASCYVTRCTVRMVLRLFTSKNKKKTD